MFLKNFILIILFQLLLFSSEITVFPKEVKNANTVLITLKEKNIQNPKLTFDKQNIDFFNHPKKEDTYYALVPVSYYKKTGDYRIIISYVKNSKKLFKGLSIKVIDGKYKSEKITVSKGKVSLSNKNKIRTKKEYTEAINIYNKVSKELFLKGNTDFPLSSKITSSFGKKRVYNGSFKSYHSGTDYKAKELTPIKAINDGIVVIAQNRFYAGNSIVINHGQGLYSCYFHLKKMHFKVGDYIKKAEILGLSGSTGRVTGPHLHFAFRVHGIQVDPLQLIKLLNKLNTY